MTEHVKGPYRADKMGGYIFAGKENFMFAQVRGWGNLQYKKNGSEIQDANLAFMEKSLNSHEPLVALVEKLLKKQCSCCTDPEFKVLGHAEWCDVLKALSELR